VTSQQLSLSVKRSEFAFVAILAAVAAIAYGSVLGETHCSVRTQLRPFAIAKGYAGLLRDRLFIVPAVTVSLIMGGLFSIFSATPRILMEAMHFTPIEVGVFFAGTVLIVFAAGMLARQLASQLGLDRSICLGLLATVAGGVAILTTSIIWPTFLPFLCSVCVFLLGNRKPARHGTSALSIRKTGRCSLSVARLLANDGGGIWSPPRREYF
jgi:DHA1 family bicyclomycin/chloramphenicol resistance-like MFS transporter